MYVSKAKSQNHLSARFSYHRIHHLLATIEPLQSTGWPGSDYFWVGRVNLANHHSVGHFFTWPTMIILVIFSHPQDKLQQQQWRTHSKIKKCFSFFPHNQKLFRFSQSATWWESSRRLQILCSTATSIRSCMPWYFDQVLPMHTNDLGGHFI